jgi:hypothetical protein
LRSAQVPQELIIAPDFGIAVSTLPRKRADFQHGQSLRENL